MIRTQIKNALTILGLSQYQFCKDNGIALSNFSAYMKGKNTLSAEKLSEIMSVLSNLTNALKRFKLTVKLDNGDVINCAVTARDMQHAIDRLNSTPEFINFVGENKVVSVDGCEIGKETVNPDNFVLQKSETDGFWVLTDLRTKIVCKFRQGCFEEQKNTLLFDGEFDELTLATSMREMSDYMLQYHSDLI